MIWHDGQGACLFSKRLERGQFVATPTDGAVLISPAQLGYMLEGIDWRAPQHTLAASDRRLITSLRASAPEECGAGNSSSDLCSRR